MTKFRKKVIIIFFGIILAILSLPQVSLAADYYDWSVRMDRDGKPAGIFTSTPFPVVETDTTYSITNDGGTTVYTLGSIYFVDGAASGCTNGATTYNPAIRSCGSGSYTIYTTVANGLSAVSAGNKTILVRAGAYISSNTLLMKDGIDNTHRYSLIGYNQERPIIDFDSQTSGNGFSGQGNSTIQRIEIKNTYDSGIRFLDTYSNAIDVYIHDVKAANGSGGFHGEGTGASNAWMYHNTVSRTRNHGIKVSDNQDNTIFEWGIIEYTGFWDPEGDAEINDWHSIAADFVSHESTGGAYIGTGNIFRYNIVRYGYSWLMNIEHQEAFSIHHNEFHNAFKVYDSTKFPKAGCGGTCADAKAWVNDNSSGAYTVDFNESSDGSFYSNVVRDKVGAAETTNEHGHIQIHNTTAEITIGDINIHNNLIYQSDSTNVEEVMEVSGSLTTGQIVNIYNNTVYADTAASPDTLLDDGWAGTTNVKNNLFYQVGTGSVIAGTITADYNLYYYPSGTIGIIPGSNDINNLNPNFMQAPSGAYDSNDGYIQSNSPVKNKGVDLSSFFVGDINLVSRPQGLAWDIGAYEYVEAAPPPIKGDFNSDSKVNSLDFTSFKNAFKSIFNAIFDLNSDSSIDVKDLGVLMSSWLP